MLYDFKGPTMDNKIYDEPATAATDAVGKDGVTSDSRRRFTRAGIGVSAIFTLASRPVLAGQCFTPSAAVSGNLSTHGTPPMCSGRSPGFWKENTSAWQGTNIDPGTCTSTTGNSCNNVKNWSGGTSFHSYFSGNLFTINNDQTKLSMMQVLQLHNSTSGYPDDPDNLGAHIVAALLNAISGFTPVLTQAQVVNMWNEWVTKRYFEPTAGVQWTSLQIVAYIQSTFDS